MTEMYSDFDDQADDSYSAAESFREQAAAARNQGDLDSADELDARAVAHYREATGVAEHLNGEDVSEAETEAAENVRQAAEAGPVDTQGMPGTDFGEYVSESCGQRLAMTGAGTVSTTSSNCSQHSSLNSISTPPSGTRETRRAA